MNDILTDTDTTQHFNVSYNGQIQQTNCNCQFKCGDCRGQDEVFVCGNVNVGLGGRATGSCTKGKYNG